MPNPVAAHTFDFIRVYLSQRTGGAPGSGTWSVATTIFDGTLYPTEGEATTFSAGGLQSTDPYGIVTQDNNGLAFLGNGLPTAPIELNTNPSSGYWNMSQGAFFDGVSTYYALQYDQAGAGTIQMINAQTGALVDGTHGPGSISGQDGTEAAIQRIDNTIYVFTTTDGTDENFAIWPFDLTTGLWGASFAALTIGPNFGGMSLSIGGIQWTNALFKMPNGDFIVFYQNQSGALHSVYRIWSALSSTWGSEVTLSGTNFANVVIDPSFSPIHIFTYTTTSNQTAGAVNYSALSYPSYTLTSTITTIPAANPTPGESDGVGHPSIQNGMLFVPRDDFADFDNSVWVATLPVTAFFKETLPVPPGESGAIVQLTSGGTGTGYAVGDTGTIDGGAVGFLATYVVNAVRTNAISTYSWATPNLGTGYAPGDLGTVDGGGILANYEILSVLGGGAVDQVIITSLGQGYSTGLTTTTATTGVGTGLKIDILSVFNGVTNLGITNAGGGYSVVNGVGTATGGAQPGIGMGLTVNIIRVAGKTPSCAYMMFPNGYSLSVGPTPINLACPIGTTATVGIPYTGMLLASGGTPPYTYAIIG